ncbi:MAG: F0F1 ATP synthase subunit A [Candidatus Pacebacteria bacterium]|nr:F0F1 ATP synthase subunit A [Candidatus Paceibacterota bacterium]MBP9840477.1 F0F1 ATP synthase subunit A [Candidatus Paceibacterota bacterium]
MEGGIAIHLAPSALGHIGEYTVTNTLVTVITVSLLLLAFAFVAGRSLRMKPGKGQAVLEAFISIPYDFVRDTLGNDKVTRRLFPIIMTIFVLVLAVNWFALLPFVGAIGTDVESHGAPVAHEVASEDEAHTPEYAAETSASEHHFVPYFYPGSTDLNFTLMLALVAFFAIEIAGIATLGLVKYAGKFLINPLRDPVGSVVGLIEIITELARIVSFSFRLFGNIFAGKVLLLVAMFFVPLFLPIPVLAFEMFVGAIQAVVFAMLTLFFAKGAIEVHGDHAHEDKEHKKDHSEEAVRHLGAA